MPVVHHARAVSKINAITALEFSVNVAPSNAQPLTDQDLAALGQAFKSATLKSLKLFIGSLCVPRCPPCQPSHAHDKSVLAFFAFIHA